MITKQTILEAHNRIKPYIHQTPVMTSAGIDRLAGCSIFFKCENFQKVGAFKMRGAVNTILLLTPEERKNGVAAHSSGNHAQAVALAAGMVDTRAHIVMPVTAAAVKKKAVLGYGARVIECEPGQKAREATLAEVIKDTGATEIHPYNDYRIMAGQATAAKELIDATSGLDVIITPVGGGGLLSGTALATSFFSPSTTVVAGEPAGADDAFRSMQAGRIESIPQPASIADGLLASLGDKTFAVIKDHVQEIVTVTDEEIIQAMRLLWERMKIIVEPSGAVPLAALLKSKDRFPGKKVGIILSGGNVDLDKIASLFDPGLLRA